VLKTRGCRIQLQSIDGGICVVATKHHPLEITYLEGQTRQDWFLEVQMTARDLLFGETFFQGEGLHFNGRTGAITSWDWKAGECLNRNGENSFEGIA